PPSAETLERASKDPSLSSPRLTILPSCSFLPLCLESALPLRIVVCILPSSGPFHASEKGCPLSSKPCPRHDSTCGVSFRMMTVRDFIGCPIWLCAVSSFQVPTNDDFVCEKTQVAASRAAAVT